MDVGALLRVRPALRTTQELKDIKENLRKFPLFVDWSDEALLQISGVLGYASFLPGEVVTEAGEAARCVYLLLSGTCDVAVPHPHGPPVRQASAPAVTVPDVTSTSPTSTSTGAIAPAASGTSASTGAATEPAASAGTTTDTPATQPPDLRTLHPGDVFGLESILSDDPRARASLSAGPNGAQLAVITLSAWTDLCARAAAATIATARAAAAPSGAAAAACGGGGGCSAGGVGATSAAAVWAAVRFNLLCAFVTQLVAAAPPRAHHHHHHYHHQHSHHHHHHHHHRLPCQHSFHDHPNQGDLSLAPNASQQPTANPISGTNQSSNLDANPVDKLDVNALNSHSCLQPGGPSGQGPAPPCLPCGPAPAPHQPATPAEAKAGPQPPEGSGSPGGNTTLGGSATTGGGGAGESCQGSGNGCGAGGGAVCGGGASRSCVDGPAEALRLDLLASLLACFPSLMAAMPHGMLREVARSCFIHVVRPYGILYHARAPAKSQAIILSGELQIRAPRMEASLGSQHSHNSTLSGMAPGTPPPTFPGTATGGHSAGGATGTAPGAAASTVSGAAVLAGAVSLEAGGLLSSESGYYGVGLPPGRRLAHGCATDSGSLGGSFHHLHSHHQQQHHHHQHHHHRHHLHHHHSHGHGQGGTGTAEQPGGSGDEADSEREDCWEDDVVEEWILEHRGGTASGAVEGKDVGAGTGAPPTGGELEGMLDEQLGHVVGSGTRGSVLREFPLPSITTGEAHHHHHHHHHHHGHRARASICAGSGPASVLVIPLSALHHGYDTARSALVSSRLALLAGVEALRCLNAAQLAELALAAHPMWLAAGAVVARQGTPVPALYLVQGGEVRLLDDPESAAHYRTSALHHHQQHQHQHQQEHQQQHLHPHHPHHLHSHNPHHPHALEVESSTGAATAAPGWGTGTGGLPQEALAALLADPVFASELEQQGARHSHGHGHELAAASTAAVAAAAAAAALGGGAVGGSAAQLQRSLAHLSGLMVVEPGGLLGESVLGYHVIVPSTEEPWQDEGDPADPSSLPGGAAAGASSSGLGSGASGISPGVHLPSLGPQTPSQHPLPSPGSSFHNYQHHHAASPAGARPHPHAASAATGPTAARRSSVPSAATLASAAAAASGSAPAKYWGNPASASASANTTASGEAPAPSSAGAAMDPKQQQMHDRREHRSHLQHLHQLAKQLEHQQHQQLHMAHRSSIAAMQQQQLHPHHPYHHHHQLLHHHHHGNQHPQHPPQQQQDPQGGPGRAQQDDSELAGGPDAEANANSHQGNGGRSLGGAGSRSKKHQETPAGTHAGAHPGGVGHKAAGELAEPAATTAVEESSLLALALPHLGAEGGTVAGEAQLYGSFPATVVAAGPVRLLALPRETLLLFPQLQPVLAELAMGQLTVLERRRRDAHEMRDRLQASVAGRADGSGGGGGSTASAVAAPATAAGKNPLAAARLRQAERRTALGALLAPLTAVKSPEVLPPEEVLLRPSIMLEKMGFKVPKVRGRLASNSGGGPSRRSVEIDIHTVATSPKSQLARVSSCSAGAANGASNGNGNNGTANGEPEPASRSPGAEATLSTSSGAYLPGPFARASTGSGGGNGSGAPSDPSPKPLLPSLARAQSCAAAACGSGVAVAADIDPLGPRRRSLFGYPLPTRQQLGPQSCPPRQSSQRVLLADAGAGRQGGSGAAGGRVSAAGLAQPSGDGKGQDYGHSAPLPLLSGSSSRGLLPSLSGNARGDEPVCQSSDRVGGGANDDGVRSCSISPMRRSPRVYDMNLYTVSSGSKCGSFCGNRVAWHGSVSVSGLAGAEPGSGPRLPLHRNLSSFSADLLTGRTQQQPQPTPPQRLSIEHVRLPVLTSPQRPGQRLQDDFSQRPASPLGRTRSGGGSTLPASAVGAAAGRAPSFSSSREACNAAATTTAAAKWVDEHVGWSGGAMLGRLLQGQASAGQLLLSVPPPMPQKPQHLATPPREMSQTRHQLQQQVLKYHGLQELQQQAEQRQKPAAAAVGPALALAVLRRTPCSEGQVA